MATNLPTNFVDDVLASSMSGKRRYTQTTNSDGSVSFTDVTEYSTEGSTYGASRINATNQAINSVSADLDTTKGRTSTLESGLQTTNGNVSGLQTKLPSTITGFTVGADGKPYITYKVGADSVTKKLGSVLPEDWGTTQSKDGVSWGTYTFDGLIIGETYLLAIVQSSISSRGWSTTNITGATTLWKDHFNAQEVDQETWAYYGTAETQIIKATATSVSINLGSMPQDWKSGYCKIRLTKTN